MSTLTNWRNIAHRKGSATSARCRLMRREKATNTTEVLPQHSIPIEAEGEHGWGIHLIETETGKTPWSAFVLENDDEENTAKFI